MSPIPQPYGPADRPDWWTLPGPPPPFDAGTERRAMEDAVHMFGHRPNADEWARMLALVHHLWFKEYARAEQIAAIRWNRDGGETTADDPELIVGWPTLADVCGYTAELAKRYGRSATEVDVRRMLAVTAVGIGARERGESLDSLAFLQRLIGVAERYGIVEVGGKDGDRV